MSTVIRQLHRAVLGQDGAGMTDGQLLERFISKRDEAAFAALVRRHGPMVWGVCRRVLGSHHDAEDAFQATFLVLVRKAASIASRELLANWLYGVAHRTALKAMAAAVRRRGRERQVMQMPERATVQQDLWMDLQPFLDRELSRLPEKYRVPIILCDLEGKSIKEAARHLGWPQGTLAGRLARARAMLAKTLARHGLSVSGGALAGLLSQSAASASLPISVMASTINAAALVAANPAAASSLISAKVAALTEGVLKIMLLNKLRIATAVFLVVVCFGIGIGGLAYRTQAAGQGTSPVDTVKPKGGLVVHLPPGKAGNHFQAVDARLAVAMTQEQQQVLIQATRAPPAKAAAKQPSGRAKHGVTHVLFSGPTGAKITSLDFADARDRQGKLAKKPETRGIPAHFTFTRGKTYRLKLFKIPNRPGLDVYPSLEVLPANPQTGPFLAHNLVRVVFTEEDLDAVAAGRFLTKVLYLPNPDSPVAAAAAAGELISPRVDPGVDAIAEAKRQGHILAIVRLGVIDAPVQKDRTKRQPEGGKSVKGIVGLAQLVEKALLRKLPRAVRGVVRQGAALRTLRAIRLLEVIGNRQAQQVLQNLAGGAPQARVTREASAACKRLGNARWHLTE